MPNLITTFRKVKSHNPCGQAAKENHGWNLLCRKLNSEMDMDKSVTLLDILESNGIKDAVWSLRCWKYKGYCLLLANIAESVLPIFEKRYPEDKRPKLAIEAIRDFKAGKITEKELKLASGAAFAASGAAFGAAFGGASAFSVSADSVNASFVADAVAFGAAACFDPTFADAFDSINAAASSAVDLEKQWDIIEKLMRDFINS